MHVLCIPKCNPFISDQNTDIPVDNELDKTRSLFRCNNCVANLVRLLEIAY